MIKYRKSIPQAIVTHN